MSQPSISSSPTFEITPAYDTLIRSAIPVTARLSQPPPAYEDIQTISGKYWFVLNHKQRQAPPAQQPRFRDFIKEKLLRKKAEPPTEQQRGHIDHIEIAGICLSYESALECWRTLLRPDYPYDRVQTLALMAQDQLLAPVLDHDGVKVQDCVGVRFLRVDGI
ncbi:hypothetical protein CLAFUW4_06724 [Fulvia fulva]|nr:hypothetical protein CLAFUR4_06732 [Fulvia fulva]WPV16295.1 hypothetical protein CLAFUW4_06724 [Fulvia fulva]WPV31116.1 hypothetical protein CLAFUW7_06723 [Fulvia fulva]